MTMSSKDLNKSRKENDDLKTQVASFHESLQELKTKMTNVHNGKKSVNNLEQSVQYMSDEYDELPAFRSTILKDLQTLSN